jgi:GTP-binding protein HflX
MPETRKIERGCIVGVDSGDGRWDIDSTMDEMAKLASTAGVVVVERVKQRLDIPNPAFFIGRGKVEQLLSLKQQHNLDVLLFDGELSPRQLRNLENVLEMKVVDRPGLILDIFARRARTHEGRLQVELAQLEYRLPRLTRLWTHLSRQGVGGVGLRGPGETQLEIDRRRAKERIAHLRRELEEVRAHRDRYRSRRREEQLPVISLVGYTNAGKSTLMRYLSGANVLVDDKLFATLDPTSRLIRLPKGTEAILTDTVGFIQRLPTALVAAFKATLEEIGEASVLIHVVDITHPQADLQVETVNSVLRELGFDDKPTVVALNKVDRLLHPSIEEIAGRVLSARVDYVPISAAQGWGVDLLLERAEQKLADSLVPIRATIPYSQLGLLSAIRRRGIIEKQEFGESGTTVVGKVPKRLMAQLQPYAHRRR